MAEWSDRPGQADAVATTGLIVQEVLQGAVRAAARDAILERFAHLELVMPELDDHRAAADHFVLAAPHCDLRVWSA